MTDLQLSLFSLVIGIAATLVVSHYYFRRSVNKSLTPFLQFTSSLFRGVSPEVREALRIEYRGVPVAEIQEIQFLIANTGERAIRDVIEPLSVAIPSGCTLLDATVLHTSPAERSVSVGTTDKAVRFEFPLLNSGEFFLVRLLLNGQAKATDFQFRITADDLPPKLSPRPMQPDLVTSSTKREFESGLLVASAIFGVCGAACSAVIYRVWTTEVYLRSGFWSWLPEWSWLTVAAAVGALPALLFIVLSVMFLFGAFTNFSFPRRRRFIIPTDQIRHRHPFYIDEFTQPILLTDAEKPDA